MKVLMITGDKNFSASPRFALQARAVERLVAVYMGPGSVWPKIPRDQFDVVTAQDPFWRGLFAWIAARRSGARLNIQVHTSVLNILGRFMLCRADSIRVVSEKIKKQVDDLGVRAPVGVVPVFVDIGPLQKLVHVPHVGKIILWLGRFEPEKDPTLALSVLVKVREAGIDAKLIMLGAGSLEATLREKAAGLPVEFPGWQDPRPYLAQADVALCTSKHESWGASIVEALAAGVPVVAPDVGIAREAGALIAARFHLAAGVADVLRAGTRGELTLKLLSEKEWAEAWKRSL